MWNSVSPSQDRAQAAARAGQTKAVRFLICRFASAEGLSAGPIRFDYFDAKENALNAPTVIEEYCSHAGCTLPAKTTVESRGVCLLHFFKVSYEKLDKLSRETGNWSYGGAEWESARRITKECAQGASDYSQNVSELSNLERARLLDIAMWAAELGRRLRRSPRRPLKLNIRVISELPGRSWSEETYTVDVGRDGTQIVCTNAAEIGDILDIIRLDTAEQMQVRVIWRRRMSSGVHEVGTEVVGSKCVWNQ